jgi:mannose-6-phosphate isomerase-like protein (cupin superfamily)
LPWQIDVVGDDAGVAWTDLSPAGLGGDLRLIRPLRVASRVPAATMAASTSSASEGEAMSTTARFLRRDPSEAEPWEETCGQIRCLIEEKDGAAAEVHHVRIRDAKLHYHERTDEVYHVISGEGAMLLDGEEISLRPGVVVYVPRGVRHQAKGDLTVLVVCIPPGVLGDIHELE